MTSASLTPQILKTEAHEVRYDLGTLSRVLFLLICHLTTIAKHACFYTKAQEIDELINTLDEPLFNQEGEIITRLLVNTARSTTRLVHIFTSAAVLTCLLWAILPAIEFARGKDVQFFFWMFGVRYTESPGLTAKLQDVFGTSILILFLCGAWMLCMAAYRSLTLCGRAMLYSTRLRHENGPAPPLRYNTLTEYLEMRNNSFRYAFRVINLVSIEFLSMVGFIGCILLELFLYCYFGNEVTVESNCLIESIYNMDWLSTPVGFQKSLVLVMERAKRPLRPVAGGIIPLSLGTFITVLKSSYSFFAVLRQTK
ncbi:Odorant receptor 94b [Eumeta japonica]|uniref:Odorant receptor 94b n=1 Tax=Eumeta variegata TaxID=151549 RepID=A0A4C1WQH4_EUMVA|nr:Odorant receptor 94b [Eumeta japonica]